MNTRDAFEKMIAERNIHIKLGVPSGSVRIYRNSLKTGKTVSLDLMEKLLLKAGWIVVQEKIWEDLGGEIKK